MLSETQIQHLRDSLTISTLLTPSDQGYAESLKRWSDANEKPAAAVLMAENENDIASAIKFATKFHVDLAVRGGGHSHWDASSSDGGLVIDLSNMNKVTVDTDTKTAVVQGGALWMHVDEALGERGLAAVGGTVNHTGVGGLALGGGYGYLSGQHGLTVDNTLRVRMVLADGTIVNASETENTDLFWAVRGAGHNFGVAVEFVFQAYDKPNKVFCGMMLFLAGKAPAIAEFLQEWRTTQQPNETIAMALIVPPHLGGQAAIGLTIFFDGPEDEANSRFAGLIEIGPVANYTGMMPYSNVNSIVAKTEPHGRRKTVKGGMWAPPFKMNNLQPVIDEFTAMHKSYPEFGGSAIILQHDFTGKITSVPNDAMAFPNRGPDNLMLIQIVSDDPKLDGVKREYAHKIMALMHKLSEGRIDDEHGPVIYCNYAMGTESAREVYRHNYERLSSLKAKYDPNNVFCKFIPIEPKPQQAQ